VTGSLRFGRRQRMKKQRPEPAGRSSARGFLSRPFFSTRPVGSFHQFACGHYTFGPLPMQCALTGPSVREKPGPPAAAHGVVQAFFKNIIGQVGQRMPFFIEDGTGSVTPKEPAVLMYGP